MSNRDRVFSEALAAMNRDRKERGQESFEVEQPEAPAGYCRMRNVKKAKGYGVCGEVATHQMRDGTGKILPGCVYCPEHAAEVEDTYCGVLGWGFTMELIEEEETDGEPAETDQGA